MSYFIYLYCRKYKRQLCIRWVSKHFTVRLHKLTHTQKPQIHKMGFCAVCAALAVCQNLTTKFINSWKGGRASSFLFGTEFPTVGVTSPWDVTPNRRRGNRQRVTVSDSCFKGEAFAQNEIWCYTFVLMVPRRNCAYISDSHGCLQGPVSQKNVLSPHSEPWAQHQHRFANVADNTVMQSLHSHSIFSSLSTV